MSDYSLYLVAKPCGYPLVANDKGDITNRVKCAYEQTKNKAIYTAQTAAVAAGAGAATYGVLKYPVLNKAYGKAADIVLRFGGKLVKRFLGENSKLYTKAAKFVKKLPTKAKIAGLIALPALLAINYISNKMTYKAGQIDQKYTDKALMEQKLKDAMIDF